MVLKGRAQGFIAWLAMKCSSFCGMKVCTSGRSAAASIGRDQYTSVKEANCLLERMGLAKSWEIGVTGNLWDIAHHVFRIFQHQRDPSMYIFILHPLGPYAFANLWQHALVYGYWSSREVQSLITTRHGYTSWHDNTKSLGHVQSQPQNPIFVIFSVQPAAPIPGKLTDK